MTGVNTRTKRGVYDLNNDRCKYHILREVFMNLIMTVVNTRTKRGVYDLNNDRFKYPY